MDKKGSVSEIKEPEFNKAINDKKYSLTIVDFFANWCGPCQMIAPIIESISKKIPNVKFCKINIDENNKLADKYQVSSIPCIIFFKNGKEVSRNIGFSEEEALIKKIKEYL